MFFSFIPHSLLFVGLTFAYLAIHKKRDTLLLNRRVFHGLYTLKQITCFARSYIRLLKL